MLAHHVKVFFEVYYFGKLPIYWFNERVNFGDAINVFLISKISKKEVVWINPKYWPFKHYLVIGSVLETMNKNSLIWGAGFISENSKVSRPKQIFAVRGPKTKKKFSEAGIECPEVYGDPALLLPLFYPKTKGKKYKIGIIPHYVDKSHEFFKTVLLNDIKIIDIEQEDPLLFINDLIECEMILSSSLHGLIIADAYKIPSVWIKFSENIKGEDFKFYDYFESVSRHGEKPIYMDSITNLDEIFYKTNGSRPIINTDILLDCCPFRK